MLVGAPKIGKSHFTIKLASDLNTRCFNKSNYVHCMTLTTKHFDGYLQQPIVVLDDHYKLCDGKQEIDASAVFNMVSCTKFYPPFASMEYKGLEFNSKFVIITSNFGFPRTQFLSTALHRRHKHHVIMLKTKSMQVDFSHITFYHAVELIDPWQGNYQYPFSERIDIPLDEKMFKLFPFKHLYNRVTYEQLLDILVDDYQRELNIYQAISDQAINKSKSI
nr:helicase [Hepelivirales sp.]